MVRIIYTARAEDPMRASTFALLALLVACSGDTGLSTGGDENDIVAGDGTMLLEPAEVTISDCEVGYGKDGVFTISSVGENDLLVYEVRITSDPSDVFFIDDWDQTRTFAPGAAPVEVRVVATLALAEPADGNIQVRTNDPDQTRVDVPIRALPVGWQDDTGDTGADTGDTGADTGDTAQDTGADTGDTAQDTGADTGDTGA